MYAPLLDVQIMNILSNILLNNPLALSRINVPHSKNLAIHLSVATPY